jgi:hypothetical protein
MGKQIKYWHGFYSLSLCDIPKNVLYQIKLLLSYINIFIISPVLYEAAVGEQEAAIHKTIY